MNGTGARAIRLLLVDCQPAVRKGLRMRLALEPDVEVVGEACDASEAIPLARDLRPDVILMDVELPGVGGVPVIEALRGATPHSAVVIFTLRDDAATRSQSEAAGASAFVAKHRTEETLLAAIRGAAPPRGEQRRGEGDSRRSEEEHRHDMRDRGGS
ncbi:MAG: response regulator [Rubrobacteraceae bacterium]